MEELKNLIEKYYELFKGLPGDKPIVRANQINDAFEIVVLKIMYSKILGLTIDPSNIDEIRKYIVAPPDEGIDIFVQQNRGDESFFDVIQVKNQELSEDELKVAFDRMRRTINDYCKSPTYVKSENCRAILSESDLDKSQKGNCTYYVVHAGTLKDFPSKRKDEEVITATDLFYLSRNREEYVECDVLPIGPFVKYEEDSHGNEAVVCSLNGFDLAELCYKYYSTQIGCNILFGGNFREGLRSQRSKTHAHMDQTITKNPNMFWFYNNGITIIAESFDIDEAANQIRLEKFSIVNGAQTTSTLSDYLRQARMSRDEKAEGSLKQVKVLARILKIPNESDREEIAIYTNTQNAITSRDMVSRRPEQKALHDWLLNEDFPQIYVEIRRGSTIPSGFSSVFKHRKTDNEALAQLAYAFFLRRPHTAKDKKSSLFTIDYTVNQDETPVNETYDYVFHYDANNPEYNGVLFSHSKEEIDEALFVQYLYSEAKKYLKKYYEDNRDKAIEKRDQTSDAQLRQGYDARIESYEQYLDTIGVCMYYYLAMFSAISDAFSESRQDKHFDYDKYYSDATYRNNIAEEVGKLFLMQTSKLLIEGAKKNGKANMNNWVRGQKCQEEFLSQINDLMIQDLELGEKFAAFVASFMR